MIKEILQKDGFICDMDGVIYHGNKILDGVTEFVNWMIDNNPGKGRPAGKGSADQRCQGSR